jgi:hypothetical protein
MVKSAAPGIDSIALHLRDNELIEAKERIMLLFECLFYSHFHNEDRKVIRPPDGKRWDERNQLRCMHRNLRNTNSVEIHAFSKDP